MPRDTVERTAPPPGPAGSPPADVGVLITIDIDWAPDSVVDAVAAVLVEHRVRATWFVTHAGASVERLREHEGLFELGSHPNFTTGSTHGEEPVEVLRHCAELVPGARAMRTHGLHQSSGLLTLAQQEIGVEIDASLFLPHTPGLAPIDLWTDAGRLIRVPYLWEDDAELFRPAPIWRLEPLLALGDGLKVLDFHPIHVFLNSSSLAPYRALKARHPHFLDVRAEQIADLVAAGDGTATLFAEAVAFLAARGGGRTVSEVGYGSSTTATDAPEEGECASRH